ncbi:MAG: PUR family DNA/RNA-binding protein [Bacteroidia bacterium]|nr:PUR family DNA/RNA-binding protein [Bacteroidia bacterium]
MEDYKYNDQDRVFSKRVKAGKRTYFFDVRETKNNDYYVTITESKKKFDDQTFVKQKIFLYKEDFNKFVEALNETVGFVKKELLPEYNFDEFTRNSNSDEENSES